ncbi:hypothetical protein [Amycolatopsis pithecellobii]|uniref:Uncharacterized protein n=1 Tax=Amycolatopsis pithecellobii TaxID=664692 RepID=A0A6N7Z435_9PSEU|nr:hypothetical protein [Amycolatopsis pithecellobii]MTD53866.1 hypothetical protein [Amycolatopsis pithecellobii]
MAENNPQQARQSLIQNVLTFQQILAENIRPYLSTDYWDIDTNRRESKLLAAANSHKTTAFRYLIAAGCLAIALVAAIVIAFYVSPPSITPSSTSSNLASFIRDALARVLALLVVTAAVTFCTKNYRINKHLEVVNRTRYNALETASLYVVGVTDDARNIVVSELVRSVFSPGDTGYMNSDKEQTIIENPGSLVGILSASATRDSATTRRSHRPPCQGDRSCAPLVILEPACPARASFVLLPCGGCGVARLVSNRHADRRQPHARVWRFDTMRARSAAPQGPPSTSGESLNTGAAPQHRAGAVSQGRPTVPVT